MLDAQTAIPVAFTHHDATFPDRAHSDDAAFDLAASEPVALYPGDRATVRTGVKVAIPTNHAGLILPRSGLAVVEGLTVLNAPGLIDPGYRGEVKVILYLAPSFGDLTSAAQGCRPTRSFVIEPGDRIAQLLIVKQTDALTVLAAGGVLPDPESERGEGGFGSTGVGGRIESAMERHKPLLDRLADAGC